MRQLCKFGVCFFFQFYGYSYCPTWPLQDKEMCKCIDANAVYNCLFTPFQVWTSCKKKPKQVAIEIINLWIYLYIFPFILNSVDALDALVHCVYSKEKEKWFHHNIVFLRCCRTTTASLTIWLMFFFPFLFLLVEHLFCLQECRSSVHFKFELFCFFHSI